MLILSRKPNESIIIECSRPVTIEVVLVQCSGQQARIGFKAPPEIADIYRKELTGTGRKWMGVVSKTTEPAPTASDDATVLTSANEPPADHEAERQRRIQSCLRSLEAVIMALKELMS